MHGDGLALPSDATCSGETHRLSTVVDFMQPTFTSFLPDVLAAGAVDSTTCVIFAAAHAHAEKLTVHLLTTCS